LKNATDLPLCLLLQIRLRQVILLLAGRGHKIAATANRAALPLAIAEAQAGRYAAAVDAFFARRH